MIRRRLAVTGLRADKGKGQKSMLRYFTRDEAAAAEAAGIYIVSFPPEPPRPGISRACAPIWQHGRAP